MWRTCVAITEPFSCSLLILLVLAIGVVRVVVVVSPDGNGVGYLLLVGNNTASL